MRFADKRIRSVSDFLTELKTYSKLGQPVWYRGHGQISWKLTPTIARLTGGIIVESPLITRFKQNALSLLTDRPNNEWEWLFVMRHHGVATRLMDWSESPLVGLYFAVASHPKSDGAVWIMLPIELNKAASIRPQHRTEIPGFGDSTVLDNYLPSSLANEQTSKLMPAAAIAPRNTRRMQAQHGVYTITHRDQLALEAIGDRNHIWRLIVPASAKVRIAAELSALNISRVTLFPELDHVALHAMESL